MRKTIILFLQFLLIIAPYTFSQRGMPEFMNEYYKDRQKRMRISDYSGVDGSPYLFDDFKTGKVYMKSKKDYNMLLRFNLYEDKFEFKVDSAIYFIDNPGEVEKIELNGASYVYFKLNKKFYFVELITAGKASLISKNDVILVQGDRPEAYTEPKPPRFRRKKEVFYIVDKDNLINIVKNKKSIPEIFNDKKKEVLQYMKKEKIRINRKLHLAKLVTYYNSLINK